MQNLKNSFASFWKYRYLLQNLITRDFKLKYRRSVLGVAWSVLNPLLTCPSKCDSECFPRCYCL